MPLLFEELMCMQLASRRLQTKHFSPAFFTKQISEVPAASEQEDAATTNPVQASQHTSQVTKTIWGRLFKEAALCRYLEKLADNNTPLPPAVLDALPMPTRNIASNVARRLGIYQPGGAAGKYRARYPKSFAFTNLIDEFHTSWKCHQESLAKARLKALKDNDTDAYMEFLQHTKLTSLLHIMEITHAFMTSIGAQLEKQQQDVTSTTTTASNHLSRVLSADNKKSSSTLTADSAVPNNSDYVRFKEYVASTKDEYKLVHKSPVYVAQQPAGLYATLMPHQLVGLRFLASLHANNINGILADEMGVGKTIQTLAFLLYLKEGGSSVMRSAPPPHLILAPLSIIREWKEACEQFVRGSMKFGEFHEILAAGERLDSYDLVFLAVHRVRNATAALGAVRWSYLVVDEAHKAVSNLHTITAQSICAIPYKHRLVLTGTPLNSDLQELWSLLNFINPRIFKDMNSFDDVFRKPFQAIGAGDGRDSAEQLNDEERALLVMRLHQVIRPFMLRRTKRDIDQTLRITYHDVVCPLTFPQELLLKNLRDEKQLPCVIEGRCVNRSVLTIEQSAQSLCNHAWMVPFFSQVIERERLTKIVASSKGEDVGEQRSSEAMAAAPPELLHQSTSEPTEEALMSLGCSGKLLVLDLILRRARTVGVKTVIFTHWLDCIDLLTEYFESQGWSSGTDYVALTGASTADERKSCVDTFRSNPECLVFLVSMKAGGCGLNLQVTHLIVMLDRDYTGTNEDQAIARVFRIGQKSVVRALYLLTSDASEQRILDISARKDRPRHAIIEGGGYHVEAVTDEERREALENATKSGSAAVLDVSSSSLMEACGPHVFDHLIVPQHAIPMTDAPPEDALEVAAHHDAIAKKLAADGATKFRSGFFSRSQLPTFFTSALDECRADTEKRDDVDDLGRGKRGRSSFSVDDIVPDWFWDNLADDGVDDEEISARWKAKCAKERELQALASVSFAAAGVKMQELSLDGPSRFRRMPCAGVLC